MRIKLFFSVLFLAVASFSYSQIPFKQIGPKDAVVSDICFSKFGCWLAVAGEGVVDIYDASNQSVLTHLKDGHCRRVLSLDFSADSSLLVSGGSDSLLILWEVKTGKLLSRRKLAGVVTSVKFSPNQKCYAAGSSDHSVYVYSVSSDSLVFRLDKHQDDITAVNFSTDGKLLASAGGDKRISIVDTRTWSLISNFKVHQDWIREVKFTNNNESLISCGDDSQLKVWNISDPKNWTPSYVFLAGHRWLMSLDADQDAKVILTAGFQPVVRMYILPFCYKFKIGCEAMKIRIKEGSAGHAVFAVATRGRGVRLYDTRSIALASYRHDIVTERWVNLPQP